MGISDVGEQRGGTCKIGYDRIQEEGVTKRRERTNRISCLRKIEADLQ